MFFACCLCALNSIQTNQLGVSKNVISQVGQSSLRCRPLDSYTPDEDFVHRVLHEPEHMLHQRADFQLLAIVSALVFCKRSASVAFFAHLVFDIQVLQNLFDLLSRIGALRAGCFQHQPRSQVPSRQSGKLGGQDIQAFFDFKRNWRQEIKIPTFKKRPLERWQ